MPAMAQKKNSQGLKMVSHIKVRWYSPKGKALSRLSRDLYYHYDRNTRLIGIDDAEHYRDGDWTYKYRKMGDGDILGKLFHNEKMIPLDSTVTHQDKTIKRVRYRPVYDDTYTGIECYTREVFTVHNSANVTAVLYEDYLERDEVVGEEGLKAFVMTDFEYLIKGEYYTNSYDLYPFTGLLDYYFDQRGKVFTKTEANIDRDLRIFYFINGDMQQGFSKRDSSAVCVMNEYSDRVNDTNVEFYGLSTAYDSYEWLSMPEYSSEWCKSRSKHLPKYMGKRYYDGSNSPKCSSVWEYTFDSRNNLVRIEVIANDWHSNRCVMEIEYVQ